MREAIRRTILQVSCLLPPECSPDLIKRRRTLLQVRICDSVQASPPTRHCTLLPALSMMPGLGFAVCSIKVRIGWNFRFDSSFGRTLTGCDINNIAVIVSPPFCSNSGFVSFDRVVSRKPVGGPCPRLGAPIILLQIGLECCLRGLRGSVSIQRH